MSNSTFEGGYYTHYDDGPPVRALTFRGNTFVQHKPYGFLFPLDLWAWKNPSQDREDFINSIATFKGRFTVSESTKKITLYYEDTAENRQSLYDFHIHPFTIAFTKEFPDDAGFVALEKFDEWFRFLQEEPLEFSYEDGVDILYPTIVSGGFSDVLYFRPLIRDGASLEVLKDVGGEERFGHTALVGRWEFERDPCKAFEFHANGTVIFFGSSFRDDIYCQAGTWVADGNRLTMNFADVERWAGEWNIRISDDTLVLGQWFKSGGCVFRRVL